MTRFTVVWADEVQNEFLNHWTEAESATRSRLTEIASAIDRELAYAPEEKGAPLVSEPGCHVWQISSHLGARVVYEVSSDDRLVRVLRISVFNN